MAWKRAIGVFSPLQCGLAPSGHARAQTRPSVLTSRGIARDGVGALGHACGGIWKWPGNRPRRLGRSGPLRAATAFETTRRTQTCGTDWARSAASPCVCRYEHRQTRVFGCLGKPTWYVCPRHWPPYRMHIVHDDHTPSRHTDARRGVHGPIPSRRDVERHPGPPGGQTSTWPPEAANRALPAPGAESPHHTMAPRNFAPSDAW